MNPPRFTLPTLRQASLSVVATALLACAAPALAAPPWDIVGIRLGMTEQQARAALQAHSKQAQVDDRLLKFTFHDGARQRESPGFLATIQATIPGPPGTADTETIKIELSPPPREQRVIGVRRALSSYANPPSAERVLASLEQKYGKAGRTATFGMGMKNTVADWAEDGKPACGTRPGQPAFMPPPSQAPAELRKYRQWQQQKLAPADLGSCSARLHADMTIMHGGSSVVALVVEMVDAGAMLPALEATERWLAEMEAAAKKERLGSGATPKL